MRQSKLHLVPSYFNSRETERLHRSFVHTIEVLEHNNKENANNQQFFFWAESILTSLWSSWGLWLHWNRKGNKSGHSPAGTAYLAIILTTFALARLTRGLQKSTPKQLLRMVQAIPVLHFWFYICLSRIWQAHLIGKYKCQITKNIT